VAVAAVDAFLAAAEGKRYRLKNPVFSLIRASMTVIGSIAPLQVFEKTIISES